MSSNPAFGTLHVTCSSELFEFFLELCMNISVVTWWGLEHPDHLFLVSITRLMLQTQVAKLLDWDVDLP